MKKVLTIFLLLMTAQIHAETMQGGTYTLNGSVDVMVNQGTGGTYTLNPNGDTISSNSTGGSYALYPTPYSKPADPAVSEVISAVVRSVTYGQVDPTYVSIATTSNPNNINDPEEVNNKPVVIGPDGTPGYYTDDGEFIPVNTGSDYGYENATDTVNFGRGTTTSTTSNTDEGMSPLAKTFLWLLLIIIILIILRNLWDRVQGRV